MKVIFLDIDGVLATDKQFYMNTKNFIQKNDWAKELKVPYPFDQGCVKVLNEILSVTDAVIVLSSDWKTHWSLTELHTIFEKNGVSEYPRYKTNNEEKDWGNLEKNRALQIENFIKEFNIDSYVIVDDLTVGDFMTLPNSKSKFVRTKSNHGLKESGIKNKILKVLNK
mgnify:CR=1 FL=1